MTRTEGFPLPLHTSGFTLNTLKNMQKLKKITGIALLSALASVYAGYAVAGPSPAAPLSMEARVFAVASSIERVAGQKAAIIIASDEAINAFVLPDKTIVLSKGLLSECASDDEIAFVIAHEMAHIASNDHARNYKPGIAGASLPDSRQREITADRLAALYIMAAGYDPAAAVRILYRVAPEPTDAFTERLDNLLDYLAR